MQNTDYNLILAQLKAVMDKDDAPDAAASLADNDLTIANLSNASAVLNMNLKEINWVGFYLVQNGELVLGPFQGRPACVRIAFGKGVCGTAAATGTTQLVPNVHEFPGHIACDGASNSEIVVPIFHDGKLTSVLDIDSPAFSRFTTEDKIGLEQCAALLGERCW